MGGFTVKRVDLSRFQVCVAKAKISSSFLRKYILSFLWGEKCTNTVQVTLFSTIQIDDLHYAEQGHKSVI